MNNLYLILREKLKKFILFFLLKLNFGNTDIIFDVDKNDKLFETINSSFLKALSGDTNLPEWILKLDGMSGVKFRSFMNFIFNNNNNINLNYLEIGVWRGSTLCSALYKNSLTALCIDNFSQFRGIKKKFLENANKACEKSSLSKYDLIDDDFYNINFSNVGKFDIYFYDGPHSEKNHYDAINIVKSALKDDFILIVDDWNWSEIRNGTQNALKDNKIKIVSKIEVLTSQNNKSPRFINRQFSDWHNGIFIASCKKISE